ncbi:MAG: pyridoxamine 5'-phosphate oxidase family protein [Tissierellia bacterium]|nr:pyridoxamine 5'-phosphate oxidase family protein [Tissierellia bacterium]
MFREMRRIEKLSSIDRAEEILTNGEYGVLSTIGENGYPYGVALNYVYMNNRIYVHSAKEGHKLDNIKFSSKVSFFVVSYSELIPNKFETYYDSVVCFGDAQQVEGEEKDLALRKFIEKYSKEFMESGEKYISNMKDKTTIIRINILHKTGKIGR